MKTKTVLFLLPVIICCLAGCAEPATVEEPVTEMPEEIPAIPGDPFEMDEGFPYPRENKNVSVIKFKDLTLEEVQEKIQGRWLLRSECGGVIGCSEIRDSFYVEYVGPDSVYVIRPDTLVKRKIHWRKELYGYRHCDHEREFNEDVFRDTVLHYILNDTILDSSFGAVINGSYWPIIEHTYRKN
jgi:hypothetical protein